MKAGSSLIDKSSFRNKEAILDKNSLKINDLMVNKRKIKKGTYKWKNHIHEYFIMN